MYVVNDGNKSKDLFPLRMYRADCWWAFGGGIKWIKMEIATGCLSPGR